MLKIPWTEDANNKEVLKKMGTRRTLKIRKILFNSLEYNMKTKKDLENGKCSRSTEDQTVAAINLPSEFR